MRAGKGATLSPRRFVRPHPEEPPRSRVYPRSCRRLEGEVVHSATADARDRRIASTVSVASCYMPDGIRHDATGMPSMNRFAGGLQLVRAWRRPDGEEPPPWLANLLRPLQAFRLSHLPLLMVYFAYGALGIIDVTRDMWIKERLTLTPAELAGIAVWLNLPWTIKMVFGELVDSVPIFGSQRGAYILIGAAFTATGMLTLAGAAGGWMTFARADQLYIVGALLIVIGTVIQDVVADAMSTEVVARTDAAGQPRPWHDVNAEPGMVQVLGRLGLGFGILAVAGLSGWLAGFVPRQTVFLLGLSVPAISVLGVLMIRAEAAERRPIEWRILGGGIAFGAIVL